MLALLSAAILVVGADGATTDQRVNVFAKKLVVEGDADLAALQKALASEAGRIVLADRAAQAAQALQQTAQSQALPNYFNARFEKSGDVLRLRSDKQAFRREVLADYARHQKHAAALAPGIKEVAQRLVDAPEANALLKRMLSHESAVHMILSSEDFRRRTRPDVYVLEKSLGRIFLRDDRDRLYVPEANKEKARLATDWVVLVLDAVAVVQPQLKKFGERLAPFDDLHKQMRKATSDPLFAAVVLGHGLGDANRQDAETTKKQIEMLRKKLGPHLNKLVVATPKGNVFAPDAADDIQEVLKRYRQAKQSAAALKSAADAFRKSIREDQDPLHARFRKLLSADFVLAKLGEDLGEYSADPAKVLAAAIAKVIEKGPDGKYRILKDKEEQLAREYKDVDQKIRRSERALRLISLYGSAIEDPALRKVFTSYYGRFLVERTAKSELQRRKYDGLAAWIDATFAKSPKGYILRPGKQAEIQAMLEQIRKLNSQ